MNDVITSLDISGIARTIWPCERAEMDSDSSIREPNRLHISRTVAGFNPERTDYVPNEQRSSGRAHILTVL